MRPQKGKRSKFPVSSHLMGKKGPVPLQPVLLLQFNGQKLKFGSEPKVYLAVNLFLLT